MITIDEFSSIMQPVNHIVSDILLRNKIIYNRIQLITITNLCDSLRAEELGKFVFSLLNVKKII